MKLTHLGVSHFRSIGETPVIIDLDKKITILVGQNDCGKSNVLRGLENVSVFQGGNMAVTIQESEYHFKHPGIRSRLHYRAVPTEDDEIKLHPKGIANLWATMDGHLSGAEWDEFDLSLIPVIDEWFEKSAPVYAQSLARSDDKEGRKHYLAKHWIQELSSEMKRFRLMPLRRIIEEAEKYQMGGSGHISLLASWQNPASNKRGDRAKFNRVVQLLRQLLDRKDVSLDVPRNGNEIIVVEEEGKELPLEAHGTGIHQLIIFAIDTLVEEDRLIGIEEPEIHLHPVLQRRFIKFLKEETSNRYVITTHSPTLIVPDAEVAVIHLKMVDGVTLPTPVRTDAQTLEALDDLGLRASDLLQANSVIWVEGPSDRIYLRRWLELLAPDLSEGIDYAVMIYGGRLLSHLTLEEKSAEEDVARFINLLRINQRSVVVMDSDRKNSVSEPINATKQRIVQEAQKSGAHAWVTDGREIENELSPRVIEAALKTEGLLNGSIKLGPLNKIENSMKAAMRQHPKPPWWAAYEKNKPEWAHRLCKVMQKEDLSESLVNHLEALITFIRRRR